jgi:hypothetical protein
MRYRKHAEKSEDTDETVDGPDSWNPPKLADRFAQTESLTLDTRSESQQWSAVIR